MYINIIILHISHIMHSNEVKVPTNGYLSGSSQGTGWACDRGYVAVDLTCKLLQLPKHAHLDYSGNDWGCNEPYLKRTNQCSPR